MILARWILAAMLAAQLGGLPAVASEVCRAAPEAMHSCCAPDSTPSGVDADPLCGCCIQPAFPVPSGDIPSTSPEARDGVALPPGSAAASLPAAFAAGAASRTAPERYGLAFPSFLDGSGFRC
jgi:hypothetical protein